MAYAQYYEVDENGFIIESYFLNPEVEEIPKNYFIGWGPNSLYKPQWDFQKNCWKEGDPEGALAVEKEALYGNYTSQREDLLAEGFEFNGYLIAYDTQGQQQFMMALMNLTLRPTTESVTIFTKENQYITFTKEEFFAMYDMGEKLKVSLQKKYEEMYEYITGIKTMEEVLVMPRNLKEAIILLKDSNENEMQETEATN